MSAVHDINSIFYVVYLVTTNNESMLVLQGDTRVADILETEFMRRFNQRIKTAAGLCPGPRTKM